MQTNEAQQVIEAAANFMTLAQQAGTVVRAEIDRITHRHRAELREHENRQAQMLRAIQHIAPDAGYIYVLGYGDGRRYKIGHTVNLADRLKQYQTSYPEAVRFDVTVFTLNRLALEDDLKARFAAQRIRGEWYTLTPDDLAYIKSLGE